LNFSGIAEPPLATLHTVCQLGLGTLDKGPVAARKTELEIPTGWQKP
jgi:hypothetical protein